MSRSSLPRLDPSTDLLSLPECPGVKKTPLSQDTPIFLQLDSTVGRYFLPRSTNPVDLSHGSSIHKILWPPSIFQYVIRAAVCPSLCLLLPRPKISPGLPSFAPGRDSESLRISGPQEVKGRPGASDVGRGVIRVPTGVSGPTAQPHPL